MTTTREFTRVNFSLEASPNAEFEGFTDGSLWNGWACPYFTYETATRILAASEANGYRWHYEKETDTFFVRHIDDPQDFQPEAFESISIQVDDRKLSVYAIGAYSWAWVVS